MDKKAIDTLGVVKWFSRVKGIGFITPDEGETDVVVRSSQLADATVVELKEGDRVMFDIISAETNGPEAKNVRIVGVK